MSEEYDEAQEAVTRIMSQPEMTLTDYQAHAVETAVYPARWGLVYCLLGMCGESGESAEFVKKYIRKNDPDLGFKVDNDTRMKLALELGDKLWYVANAAMELGYSLDDIAALNLDKLARRKAENTLKER